MEKRNKIYFLYDYVMPNMIMPNALITEYALINYLHSQYSNRIHQNCFTDPDAYNNISSTVFDNNLGSWPNSVRQGGSHIHSAFYQTDVYDCIEDSLYFGKRKTEKYVYLIKITPHLEQFTGVNTGIGNKLNGEYFWKHMSAEALIDAQQGKALIFIDYAQENFIEKQTYENLHEGLKNSGIPKEQIVLGYNSFNAKELYESWFTPEERRLEVHNFPFVISASSFHYAHNPNSVMSLDMFRSTKDTIRKKHFLFKIRNLREHRIVLLFTLASAGLLDKADWSCLLRIKANKDTILSHQEKYKCQIDLEKIKELEKVIPHSLESEKDLGYASISAWTDQSCSAHLDSYFYVCTETFMHGDFKSLTEKVFKPIINFQPFLFVAYTGALKVLKSLGFKTFSPYINEDYDDEPDQCKRLMMIHNEIARLCSMSKEELHEWYWCMEDTLIHNHNVLLEIYKHESFGKQLIKYLHDRTSQ